MYLTGTVNDPLARGTIIEGLMTDNSNAHALIFSTSAASSAPAERMRIANTLITYPTVTELRGDVAAKFAIGNMGGASSQMMVSSRGFLTFNVSNTGSALDATERMRIASNGVLTVGGQTSTRLVTTITENDKVDLKVIDGTDSGRAFTFSTSNSERMRISSNGNVGIGTTSSTYKLTVSGGINAGGVVTYSKAAGGLDTTGYAVAGLGTAFNGSSAGFTFTAYGGTGQYQKVVYSCFGSGTNWVVDKVIDEGTNVFDIEASASSAATIVFTFKTRSGSQGYTPRVVIEATGHSIISTYA